MSPSLKGRALAIIAGCAFAAGGLTILLGKDLVHPLDWVASQWITILTVFGTIAAGHLLNDAARARHLFAALGFLVLFISGTCLVVCQSLGRQAETFETTALSAEATNKAIADKTSDLAAAKLRRDYADHAADAEMTNQRCGKRCNDWKTNAKDISVVIKQLEIEIAALGPQRPINAKAERMADMAALFGIDKLKTRAVFTLIEPLLWTLFFEIGSIVSLGFAFRAGKSTLIVAANDCFSVAEQKQTIASSVAVQLPEPPPPPKGKRKPQLPEGVVQLRDHPVFKALQANGGSVTSHRQLSQLLGIDEGAATRRRQEVEEHLTMERRGKHLRIALKSA
jgi:hypothetical protein